MRKPFLGCLLVLLICTLPISGTPAPARAEWKAGVSSVDITPAQPMWLAGYAARNKPFQGVAMPLHAKALALEDRKGQRLVIITSDILGFPRAVSESIVDRLAKRTGLRRDQVIFTSSHTHSAPVIRESLIRMYPLDAEQASAVRSYTDLLQERVEQAVVSALAELAPATLSIGHGTAAFGINRRVSKGGRYSIGVNAEGPVDHDVPVLRVSRPDGSLKAVLFGYACHNTTLTGDNYLVHGDYAGVAQARLERLFPGVTALFTIGCAADTNPNPRGTMDLAQKHGETLADVVSSTIAGKLRPVRGPLKTRFDKVDLPLAPPPSREEFEKRLQDKDVYLRRHAEGMLETIRQKGELPRHYAYPISVARFGRDLTLVALAGEVVVDYSLRLKREFPPQDKLWVAAYANDVFAYIPSRRVLLEGGYEAETSMIYYGLPGPWAPEVEETLFARLRAMLRNK